MEKRKRQIIPQRQEVWVAHFDPAVGSEVRKTRPALVLQNDIANRYSPVTIVAAITSQAGDPLYPDEAFLRAGEGGLLMPSVVQLGQIRTVDKRRLTKRLGVISDEAMRRVERALEISLGL
ncbi:MAG: type II toxin-antitoxin system PemK/MazF family toxin, partial [Patescibacteria group bacterium]